MMIEYRRVPFSAKSSTIALCLLSTILSPGDALTATKAEADISSAQRILDAAAFDGGLIVHVGCGDGALPAALGAGKGCVVLGLDRDPAQVEAARRRVARARLSGKVAIHSWGGQRLPLADNLARLIVVEQGRAVSRDELLRVLCPGGVAVTLDSQRSTLNSLRKPWPDEIDEWTHFLHDADGNAVAQDTRVGPPRHMQWLGGPRWMRNHHMLASISAIVSQGGRMFYVLDEGPSANLEVPGKWSLVARDAFSGVPLWRHPIESWAHWKQGFRSGPVQLARLLVAAPECVYVPLGVNAPISALDAATGEVLRTYDKTQGAEEVLMDGDALLVVAASPVTAQQMAGPGKPKAARKRQAGRPADPAARYVRTLMAIEAESGERLWKWSSDEGNPDPMSLAADGRRVCFQFGKGVVCLDRESGEELWRTPGAREAPKGPRLMSDSTLLLNSGVVLWTDSETVWALDAQDGRQLWTCKTTPSLAASNGKIEERRAGFKSSADLFVIDGLVWIGAQFAEGRDLRTGEVRRTNPSAAAIQTAGHHHRCYREKATSRYILAGQRGTEFLDLVGDDHSRNNWVRGVCQYGILPCNGLLYAPPHACGCYMEAKLSGFWALAARRTTRPAEFEGDRLTQGPAYGKAGVDTFVVPPSGGDTKKDDGWSTFLHDAHRSSSTAARLPEALAPAWKTRVGGRLTAPVCAEGVTLVASVDAHQVVALDAATGSKRWSFTAGGRIDSPPTIYSFVVPPSGGETSDGENGRASASPPEGGTTNSVCLFGSADGCVYCLRLADGELVWRFFAAPEERLSVAMNQVESVWPVHGSVLVDEGVAYFCAGRSSHLDGGIRLYGLEPATGEVLCRTTFASEHPRGHGATPEQDAEIPVQPFVQNAVDARTFLAPDRSDGFSMAGTISDVMVSNGHSVFLRHVRFDHELNPQETKSRHLFSTSRLVDDTENHRIHWVLGTGDFSRIGVAYSWQVNLARARQRYAYKPNVPFAMLLAFDDQRVWGVRRPDGYKGYELVVWPNTPFARSAGLPTCSADAGPGDPRTAQGGPDIRQAKPGEGLDTGEIRTKALDMRPVSLVRAGEALILGGGPYVVPAGDPFAAYEGRTGGLIRVVRAEDGQLMAEHELSAPVVWNGLAVARGRLYAATEDGHLVCFAGKR